MSKLFFLIGLTVLAVASARVVRDAPTNELSFEKLLSSFQEGFKTLETNILGATGASNPEELKTKAEDYMKTVAKQFDSWAVDTKEKTKDLENVPAIQEIRGSIQKLTDDFNKEHPAVAEDLNKYMGKVKEGTEEVMNKIKALGDSEETKKVKELSQQLLQSAQAHFQDLTKEIREKVATN